ncbi:hypothetical protein IAR50_005221 [Cryptococcus sp. DSM 104548]
MASQEEDSCLDQSTEAIYDDSQDVFYGPKNEYCFLSFAPDMVFQSDLNPSLERLAALATSNPEEIDRSYVASQQILTYLRGWRNTHSTLIEPRFMGSAEMYPLPSRLATTEELMTFFCDGASGCEEEGCCKSALSMGQGGFGRRVKGDVDWFEDALTKHGERFMSVLDQFTEEEREAMKDTLGKSLGDEWMSKVEALISQKDDGESVYFPLELFDRFVSHGSRTSSDGPTETSEGGGAT